MRSFASDNNSGVHPLVMEALNQANQDHAVGYGDDAWTEEAVRKIREAFTPDCEPLFVFNGTGSNAVALQLCTRSYNSIICAETAHIYVDECDHPPLPGRRGEKTLTTGGPGKEQGTNKLPPTRILQRSTRGQQEMGDCSPEVLATSSEQQRPSIVKTNSMLPKTNK